jgi:flagellum-specific peptidoglycan hydrolase FlgJ
VHNLNEEFLLRAADAARAAGHIWPEYAACEAALESAWGASELALKANNLFGQKQFHPPYPGTGTISLPTREFLHGAWVRINAEWMSFPGWQACFRARMEVLERLAHEYTAYAHALGAKNGETFIREVSAVWSTGPRRAEEVLAIYARHGDLLKSA